MMGLCLDLELLCASILEVFVGSTHYSFGWRMTPSVRVPYGRTTAGLTLHFCCCFFVTALPLFHSVETAYM